MSNPPPQSFHHIPVLLDDVIRCLAPAEGDSYLDLTAGYGGHAREIIARTKNPTQAVLVDRDPSAITVLQPLAADGVRLIHRDFAAAAQGLVEAGERFDTVLVDLGVSSPQLDNAARGFSFRPEQSGPLDMRMDQEQQVTARTLVNRTSEKELVDLLVRYGEERFSPARRIAHAIRLARPIETTEELAAVVLSTHHGKWQKTHPATRTFQAIRIAVNDELGQIERFLPLIPQLLNPGGRIAIISFHSLEDRLIKRYFAEQTKAGYEAELQSLTKKGISGTHDVHNPRARSAMLRAAVKN